MLKRILFSGLMVAIAMLCVACGGKGGNSAAANGGVRLVNATQTNGLALTQGSTTLVSGINAGAASNYEGLAPAAYSMFVSAADGSLATSATMALSVASSVNYTVVAYARAGQIKLLGIADSVATPSTGFASVTTYNAGTDAGPLDIYVAAPGTNDVSNLTPTVSNVISGGSSLTQSISAGTYDIIVTGYGRPNDVRLYARSITLTSQEIVALVLTGTDGGTLVNAALVQQAGTAQLVQNTNARVRLVTALPTASPNPVVAATIGSTDSFAAVSGIEVGSYSLITGGATSYQVTVNGTALTNVPAATFAAGGDYTLLVYGSDAAHAQAAVLTDNNFLPTTGAKIRLVNGATSEAGASIALYDDFNELFSGIGYGQASDYAGVTAGLSAVEIDPTVAPFTVSYSFTSSGNSTSGSVTFTSGGIYTVFVLGSSSNAVVKLNKDR